MKINCLYDKLVSVKELKEHPKNSNRHPKEQIDRLAKILDYQGWRNPIKVSKQSGFITSGHGRLYAAKKNKWAEVPVNFQDYENEDQEIADLISDNSLASWSELDLSFINNQIGDFDPSFDLDLLGIKNFTIDAFEKGECDEDEVPEHVEPKTRLGDLYQLGEHRLMCGDSTMIDQVERLMNGEKADMVFTDPLYGLNWSGGTWAAKEHIRKAREWDKKPEQDTIDWIITLAPIIILWGGNYFSVPPSRCWLSWSKTNVNKTMSDFELAWTNLDQCCKQFDSSHSPDGKRLHATQKPVGLIEWAMSRTEAKSVLDLFGGSGSTLIACEKTNRKCFMCELDPHYVDVIVKRYENFSGKKAELIPPAQS